MIRLRETPQRRPPVTHSDWRAVATPPCNQVGRVSGSALRSSPRKVIVMFDQVLNEVLLAAIVFILVPMMIIAAVLMITGRRKHNH